MIEYICSFEEEHGFLVSASMKYGEELIRCKDCKFLRFTGTVWKCQNRSVMMLCEMDDFCSRAERKDK